MKKIALLIFLMISVSPIGVAASAKDVVLGWHYQYSIQNNPDAPVIRGIVARFNNESRKTETVIVVLKLRDENGQVIRESSAAVTIAPSAFYTHQLTAGSGLMSGTYYWSGGVLKKNNSGVLQWYPLINQFSV